MQLTGTVAPKCSDQIYGTNAPYGTFVTELGWCQRTMPAQCQVRIALSEIFDIYRVWNGEGEELHGVEWVQSGKWTETRLAALPCTNILAPSVSLSCTVTQFRLKVKQTVRSSP